MHVFVNFKLYIERRASVKRSQHDVIHAFIVCVTANMEALNSAVHSFIVNVLAQKVFNNKIIY